jgi:hypothetical protein
MRQRWRWPAACLGAMLAIALGRSALQAAPPPTPTGPARTPTAAAGTATATPAVAAPRTPLPPTATPARTATPNVATPRKVAQPVTATPVATLAPLAAAQATPIATPTATPAPLPAAAQPQASGQFSETVSGAPRLAFTLNGRNQTASYTLPVAVVDKRGSGAGWNLTVTSTTYRTAGSAPHTLPANASSVTNASAGCSAGNSCTMPESLVTYPFVLPAGTVAPPPVKLFDAQAGTGTGKFTVTPTISVTLPANAYAGSYQTTITLALVSGP